MIVLAFLAYFHRKKPIHQVNQFIGFRQYAAAKDLLDQMIADHPSFDPSLINLRALCALNMDLIAECINDSLTVIAHSSEPSPTSNTAFAQLIQAHIKTGNYTAAKHWIDQSNQSEFTEPIARLENYTELANAAFARNDIENAVRYLDAVLHDSPLKLDFILKRSELAWHLQDFASYLSFLPILSSNFPGNSTIAFRLGVVSMCDDDFLNATDKFAESGIGDEFSQILSRFNDLRIELDQSIMDKNASNAFELVRDLNESIAGLCPLNSKLAFRVSLQNVKYLHLTSKLEAANAILGTFDRSWLSDREFLFEKASIEMALHHYDSAISLYSQLQDQDGLDRANLLKRRSYFIDWYAFLGLKRESEITREQIRSSYLKLVRIWHPDRFPDPAKKKEAERLMSRINNAYDILSNPELRAAYDRGYDPYDPNATRPMEFNSYEEFFRKNVIKPEFPKEGPLRITLEV
jgi:tetratricopeptide (TPR) repeat protein